jgi:FIST N domain
MSANQQHLRAGVGFSELPGSRQAGAEAARAALDQGSLDACDLVLMFATSKHDPVAFRDGVRSVLGPRPRLFGGSAVGVITNDRMGYEGFQAGVAAIATGGVRADIFCEGGVPGNERTAGAALARQISGRGYAERPSLLLLYDIVRRREPGVGLSMTMVTRSPRSLRTTNARSMRSRTRI